MNRLPITFEHALLGILYQQPMHGYDIYKQITEPSGLWLVWRMKQSQLYALLSKLENEGYVSATLHPQDARPPRKVYALTNIGCHAFFDWLKRPVDHGRQMRIEFLAKFYFARREGVEVALALVQVQRVQCQQWLVMQQAQADALGSPQTFESLVHRFRSSQIEAFLVWLDICDVSLNLPISTVEQIPILPMHNK